MFLYQFHIRGAVLIFHQHGDSVIP